MPKVLYLHGLASSPKGRKATALRERLEPKGFSILAPDLNRPTFARLDFEAVVEEAAAAESQIRPDVILGSSMGALVALALARRAGGSGAPLVLIAPALSFGQRWSDKLPEDSPDVELFHHGEGKPLPIHREFFTAMALVNVDEGPPPVAVSIVMGTADESVPYDQVEATWKRWEATGRLASGSRFHRVEGGDHSLTGHVDEIEAAVNERLPAKTASTPA